MASLTYQAGADEACPLNRFSRLGWEDKYHVLFVVQSLAEREVHTTYGGRHPLMVCRHKEYGFAAHPVLVGHPNDAILKCDQVGGLLCRRVLLPELGRPRSRIVQDYYYGWILRRGWVHHGHIR